MSTVVRVEQRAPDHSEPRVPGARGLLVEVIGAALVVDVVVRQRVDSVAWFVGILCLSVVLWSAGGMRERPGGWLVATAPVPGLLLVVRTSPWVVVPALASSLLLLALGVGMRGADRFTSLGFGPMARRLGALAVSLLVGPVLLAEAIRSAAPDLDGRDPGRLWGIARGLLLAVPVVAVLGLLLGSADAVFASMFAWDVDVPGLTREAWFFVGSLWIVSGLVQHAWRGRRWTEPVAPPLRLGVVEAAVVLGGLVAVYGAFALSQAVVAARGHDFVVRTTGLTYAEYARSGFFQLLWAAGLTAVLLVALRATVEPVTDRERRLLSILGVAAVALTEVVVVAALVRLRLYEDAFGLTMLRLCSALFAVWVGVVFAVLGVALARPAARWLAAAVVSSGLVVVVALGVADPERVVVERNLDRVSRGAELDLDYLVALSDDAVPSLMSGLRELGIEPDEVPGLCEAPPDRSWIETNAAAAAAARARASAC